nr:ISNCY family transposase [Alkalicella caledoniensis]
MRKVILTMDENQKYEIIKKLVETNGNKKTAALKIRCTPRHISRLIKGYKEKGKAFFIHGNRGRQPSITLSEDTKKLILDLYRTKYYDCNLTHFSELLNEMEDIKVSVGTITSILRKEFILSPMATRSSRKALKKELKDLQAKTKSMKKAAVIQSSILDIEDSHPRRPRCAYFGEMLQMDASMHEWFGGIKTHLHVAIDDATGQMLGAYFDEQETLKGYYNVLNQVLTNYGIPYQFFTDNRTVFEYKRKYEKKKEASVEKDTFTQFGYACKQLGIDIQTSSVPQAKGRVERVFGTLQSRLVVELRLRGVSSIEEANKFLYSYIKKFNKRFALPIDSIKSVFETQPDNDKINLTLAVISSRKIDNGSCIKYHNEYYLPVNAYGVAVHYRKGTTAMVIKAFDGDIYCCIGEQVYLLELLPHHKPSSKAFDLATLPEKPKKKYIPPMSHPWKQASFERYLKKQLHRNNIA